ncbi:hypothetical protein FQN55_007594 [Onygenales sp. PD_40]|nr:hypothetical protein FQN55_007594 [Onygenales sp. PD_40]
MASSTKEPVPSPIDIPIIDISGYLAGDPAATKETITLFRTACENQGFLQITGHSVSPEIQERFISAIAEFFSLPIAQKLEVSQQRSKCNRGYERLGFQKLDELDVNATTDQKEGFSIRQDRPLGRFLQGENQWPAGLPGFKEAYMEYFHAVHALSKTMFGVMALSLGLEEDYFADFASDADGESISDLLM